MTDIFDDLQDGRRLTIKRADGGLLLTIATMHRMETVPLTEGRADDLARWLGGDEVRAERDEWKKLARSTEETLGQMEAECAKDLALMKADRDHWKAMEEGWRGRFNNAAAVVEEANRTGQAMGEARATEYVRRMLTSAESTILRGHESMADPAVYESACPFCGAASNASSKESHDEECDGERARRWLKGTHRPTESDPVAAQLERLKAMPSGHVEPRDTEPPRREAVTWEPGPGCRECIGQGWEPSLSGRRPCPFCAGTPAPEPVEQCDMGDRGPRDMPQDHWAAAGPFMAAAVHAFSECARWHLAQEGVSAVVNPTRLGQCLAKMHAGTPGSTEP